MRLDWKAAGISMENCFGRLSSVLILGKLCEISISGPAMTIEDMIGSNSFTNVHTRNAQRLQESWERNQKFCLQQCKNRSSIRFLNTFLAGNRVKGKRRQKRSAKECDDIHLFINKKNSRYLVNLPKTYFAIKYIKSV